MTKAQLIRALEPFTDDVDIELHVLNTDCQQVRVFYSLDKQGLAKILLAVNKPDRKRVYELTYWGV